MLETILAAHGLLQTQMKPFLESLKDKALPLDERWDAFTKLIDANIFVHEAGSGSGYLDEVFDRNQVSLYDDFHMDRGQTKTFADIWEQMTDEFFEGGDTYKNEILRNVWRERVLASGYSGFCYDW